MKTRFVPGALLTRYIPITAGARSHRQRGAVLVVGLVMLAVMTLLVVSMIKTSVVELKIGGASQVAQQNLTNAELMINRFVDLNNGRFASNFLALPEASGGPRTTPIATASYSATTALLSVQNANVYGGQANLIVRQNQCTDCKQQGTQLGTGTIQCVYFDVSSTAVGVLGGSTTIHQGVRTLVPSGSC